MGGGEIRKESAQLGSVDSLPTKAAQARIEIEQVLEVLINENTRLLRVVVFVTQHQSLLGLGTDQRETQVIST